MNRSRWALLVTVVLVLLPASLLSSAHGSSLAGARVVSLHHLNPAGARSYWTARRMSRAIPLPAPKVAPGQEDMARTPQRDGTSALGFGSIGPTAPAAGAIRLPSRLGVAAPATRLASSASFTSGAVPSSSYRTYPYSTIGRIFFTDPVDGLNYACSGTAITSQNESVVWTAGHCVHGGGAGNAYYTNWVFMPSYLDHSRPVGSWPALALLAPAQWVSSGNLHYDMAAAVVAPVSGQRLTEVTGGRGIEWNLPQSQTFTPYGYPAVAPFTGERIYYCVSDLLGNGNPPGSGPATLGIGCDMTQGSSGGGWIVDDQFVNSNVSYGVEGQPNVFYGPYFGDAAATLYAAAATSTLPGPLPTPTVPGPGAGDPTPSGTPTPPAGEGPGPSPSPTTNPDTLAPALTSVLDKPDPFSPNGDGVKDKAKLYFTLSEPSSITIAIIKPRGATLGYLVSDADAPQAARYVAKWNGKAGSKTVRNGTYKYVITATDRAGNHSSVQGTTTVRR